jgi:cytochrome c553
MGFIAYVPKGSLAKGEHLVTTGGATIVDGRAIAGRTQACTTCHGQDLRGRGDVPGIAGRLATYTARQLYDMQSGNRHTVLMKQTVQNLSEEDIIAISAYVASR